MTPLRSLRTLSQTLKARIALASVFVVVAALWVLTATLMGAFEQEYVRQAIAAQRDAATRAASQLGDRIEDRLDAMAALARLVPAGIHNDAEKARALLAAKPTPQRQFKVLFIATPEGVAVARTEDGLAVPSTINIADRAYFKRMVATGKPVISEPVRSRAGGDPVVVIVYPIFDVSGALSTVVGATIALDGPSGLNDVTRAYSRDSQTVIVDSGGRVLGHENLNVLLEDAAQLPQLSAFYSMHRKRLRGDDSHGAVQVGDQVVGWGSVAQTGWYLLEITQMDGLNEAIAAARQRALISGTVLAALGGGAILIVCTYLFWRMTHLRDRAMKVLTETVDIEEGWPEGHDEIGKLSRAFRHILRERHAAEQMGQKMLGQLQAIMDNASVGIAFTRNERFELVSPSLANLTGYSRLELSGKAMSLVAISDEKYQALRAYIESQHGRFDLEFPIRKRDASHVWVRAVGSPVHADTPDKGTIWIVEDVSEARRMREQLSWSASRDPLTELLNRREFESKVRRHLDSPNRPAAAVMFLDLDRFKQVNDSGGHAAGDRVLCELARLLESQVRSSDRVARLGGDEFAVLLPGCSLAKALEIGERIRQAVRDYRLELDGRTHAVGASVGIVAIGDEPCELADVLKAADAACYEAKRCGRDAVRSWDMSSAKLSIGAALMDGCAVV